MPLKHYQGKFLTSAISVGSSTTLESDLVGGTDFDSNKIDVTNVEKIAVEVETQGAGAGIDADIDIDLVISVQSEESRYWTSANITSQVFSTATCHAQTNAKERTAAIINVQGIAFIGIGQITNNDAAVSCDVQCYFGKSMQTR